MSAMDEKNATENKKKEDTNAAISIWPRMTKQTNFLPGSQDLLKCNISFTPSLCSCFIRWHRELKTTVTLPAVHCVRNNPVAWPGQHKNIMLDINQNFQFRVHRARAMGYLFFHSSFLSPSAHSCSTEKSLFSFQASHGNVEHYLSVIRTMLMGFIEYSKIKSGLDFRYHHLDLNLCGVSSFLLELWITLKRTN